jgi:hypothetical protein
MSTTTVAVFGWREAFSARVRICFDDRDGKHGGMVFQKRMKICFMLFAACGMCFFVNKQSPPGAGGLRVVVGKVSLEL